MTADKKRDTHVRQTDATKKPSEAFLIHALSFSHFQSAQARAGRVSLPIYCPLSGTLSHDRRWLSTRFQQILGNPSPDSGGRMRLPPNSVISVTPFPACTLPMCLASPP